jgi:hypothetical protein
MKSEDKKEEDSQPIENIEPSEEVNQAEPSVERILAIDTAPTQNPSSQIIEERSEAQNVLERTINSESDQANEQGSQVK